MVEVLTDPDDTRKVDPLDFGDFVLTGKPTRFGQPCPALVYFSSRSHQ